MAMPDTSKMISACKDQMHNEWTDFKKSGIATDLQVCNFSVGGLKDMPVSVLLSVGQGVKEWEECLKNSFDVNIERNKHLSVAEVTVGGDGQVVLYPQRNIIVEEVSSTAPSTPAPPLKDKPITTPEATFMTGVEQTSNYMLDHLKRVCENALIEGNTKVLYLSLSSSALIRGQLNVYKEAFKQPTSE